MATYIEYKLDDDTIILIEADEPEGDIVRASRDDGSVIIEARTRFQEALRSAKVSTLAMLAELNDLPIDELEITFGLKSIGEAGFFAVGKVGLEANYQVKLKWKKATP